MKLSGFPGLAWFFGIFWAETAALPATNWPNTAHTFLIFHFLSNGFQIDAFPNTAQSQNTLASGYNRSTYEYAWCTEKNRW